MKRATLLLGFCVSVFSISCRVTLISAYDQQIATQISATSKLVDKFYLTMLEQDASKRQYSQYSADYINIEVELHDIVNKSKLKQHNADAQKIAENVVMQWAKYRLEHKANDALNDAKIMLNQLYMRDEMNRLQRSEDTKKLASPTSSNN